MNILTHFILNILIGLPFKLNYTELLLLGLGGIFIDIDHIIYQYFIVKNKTIKEMWAWHKKENAIHHPHFYIFHQIELIIIFTIVSFYLNRFLFIFSLGFFLHFIEDSIMYFSYYRNLSWLKHFSVIYQFFDPTNL